MAYTRAWTTTTPADTDQASTLGAVTRNLRTDIQERMNDLLGGTWATDPVMPVNTVLYIPPNVGAGAATEGTPGTYTPWIKDFSAAGDSFSLHAPSGFVKNPWNVPVVLPVGVTLTKVRVALHCASSISSSIELLGFYVAGPLASPNLTSLGSVAAITTNSALAWFDAGIASHTVAAGEMFLAIITGFGNASHYHGLELTYTKNSLANSY